MFSEFPGERWDRVRNFPACCHLDVSNSTLPDFQAENPILSQSITIENDFAFLIQVVPQQLCAKPGVQGSWKREEVVTRQLQREAIGAEGLAGCTGGVQRHSSHHKRPIHFLKWLEDCAPHISWHMSEVQENSTRMSLLLG